MRASMRWALVALLTVGCADSVAPDTTPRLHDVILFTSDRNGGRQIHRMAPDGGGLTLLILDTILPGSAIQGRPSISPDGKWIAFSMLGDIWVARADGTEPRNLTEAPGEDEWPAWSPDGTRIAFQSDRDGDEEIYLISFDGTGLVQVTDDSSYESTPTWAPDGMRLAFSSDRTGDFEIFTVDLAGGIPVNLTQDPAADQLPAWSHEGATIAFVSDRDGFSNLYLMDADGGNVRRLAMDYFNAVDPQWGPKDTILVFTGAGMDFDIWTVRPDGTGATNLTNDTAVDLLPAWAP